MCNLDLKIMEETKKCQHCGQEIKAAAKKCHFCGQWQTEESDSQQKQAESQPAADSQTDFSSTKKKGSGKWAIPVIGILGLILAFLVVQLLPISCSKAKSPKIEYLPFQETKDGNWGLISTDGEVLFSEEFNQMPTVVINGRFMVKNSDDLWEIYTAEKKPKKIGGEYLQIGYFYENVAPAVERGGPIQLIDRNGKVKVTLDKIDGKEVESCTNFIHGKMTVKIGDYWGTVDTNGKVVIEPKYAFLHANSNGYYFAIDKKYMSIDDESRWVISILNEKGTEVGKLKRSKFTEPVAVIRAHQFADFITNRSFIAKTEKGIGLLGFDGEWKIRPMSKVNNLTQKQGKYFVFSGDNYGLLDENGEIIIRPKYNYMYMGDDDIIYARKSGSDNLALYSIDDERIGDDDYKDIRPFYDGKFAFAQVGEHDYVLINKKGEEQKLKVDIYDLDGKNPDSQLTSDYVDLDNLVKLLHISKESMMDLTLNMDALKAIETINGMEGILTRISEDAKKNSTNDIADAQIYKGKTSINLGIDIQGLIVKKQEGSGWFSYTTYDWSKNPISSYRLSIDLGLNSRLKGRMSQFYKKVEAAVKKCGKVVKQGKNAVVVDAGNDNFYYAVWAGKSVTVFYGKYNPDLCDVELYDDVDEDSNIVAIPPGVVLKSSSGQSSAQESDEEEDYGDLGSPPNEV